MKRRKMWMAAVSLFGFLIWTVLVLVAWVRPIGPQGSMVGLAGVNSLFHRLTGVNMLLYTITDWLGLVPLAVALSFALLGIAQMIRRRSLLRVDYDILALGVFYIAVMLVYILFEIVVINYRPIPIGGILEPSYPSSTTMLVLCVMPTAATQLKRRIKSTALRRFALLAIIAFTSFMVVGRVLSGVHWITDIIGGALLSSGLVMAYRAFITKRK